jgi:hypothetical protein
VIDRKVFAGVMGGFADRFGRALAPATADMYYDILAAELTTEEFLAGARIVFQKHTYNAWPAPQLFIDAAKPKPAPKLSGAEIFERILSIDGNIYTPIGERVRAIALLGPVAERAYRAVGGRREFENVLEDDVKWLRQRFLEVFESAASNEAAQREAAVAFAALDPAAKDLVSDLASKLVAPEPKQIERAPMTRNSGQISEVAR